MTHKSNGVPFPAKKSCAQKRRFWFIRKRALAVQSEMVFTFLFLWFSIGKTGAELREKGTKITTARAQNCTITGNGLLSFSTFSFCSRAAFFHQSKSDLTWGAAITESVIIKNLQLYSKFHAIPDQWMSLSPWAAKIILCDWSAGGTANLVPYKVWCPLHSA